jgi:hypothetical protein
MDKKSQMDNKTAEPTSETRDKNKSDETDNEPGAFGQEWKRVFSGRGKGGRATDL